VTELASLAKQQPPQDQHTQQQQIKQKQRKQKPESDQPVLLLLHHPNVQHALAVVRAFRACNWQRFVQLYEGAPAMTPYLMDKLLPPLRRQALQAMLVGCRPTKLPLSSLAQALGFETEDDAAAFAANEGAVVNFSDMVLETVRKEESKLQSKEQQQQQQQHRQAEKFAQGKKKGKKRKK